MGQWVVYGAILHAEAFNPHFWQQILAVQQNGLKPPVVWLGLPWSRKVDHENIETFVVRSWDQGWDHHPHGSTMSVVRPWDQHWNHRSHDSTTRVVRSALYLWTTFLYYLSTRRKNGESCWEHAYRGLYCTSGTECLSQYGSKKQKWGKLWGTCMVRKVFY